MIKNYNLDYPGGFNRVTRVLIGRRQEGQGQRRCGGGSRGHGDMPGAKGCMGPLGAGEGKDTDALQLLQKE